MSKSSRNVNIGKWGGGGYIGSLVLVSLLVAAPAKAEEFVHTYHWADQDAWITQAGEHFMEWRTSTSFNSEKRAEYAEGATVEVLLSLHKGGAINDSNGQVTQWSSFEDAWYFEQLNETDWSVNIYGPAYAEQGRDIPNIVDLGIVLTGSRGSRGFMNLGLTGITGMMRDISIQVNGTWATLGLAFSPVSDFFGVDIEFVSYLEGQRISRGDVDIRHDASMTFIWSELITELLGEGDVTDAVSLGEITIRFDNRLRNQHGLAFIAVIAPAEIPEPATLALMGLGLAGVGIARRRMKK